MTYFLVRDLDSKVTPRETAAVSEWLQSGAAIHSMRDNPAHTTPLLGAGWGANLMVHGIRHSAH